MMIIRLEEEKDWCEVENLTREAFWNVYRPGCFEHFVLHKCRTSPDFVKELDYLMIEDDQIVAHIMYCKAVIKTDEGKKIEMLMFGPVSVLPIYQHKGYGSKIINFTLEKAKELGHGAVAITGNPDFYHRFGFESGSAYHIYCDGMPREEDAPFFMVKELKDGYLSGVIGTFKEPDCYTVEDHHVDEFDKQFPPKKKEKRPGQLV
jgi:predicted N-acetyltransferase YhbS